VLRGNDSGLTSPPKSSSRLVIAHIKNAHMKWTISLTIISIVFFACNRVAPNKPIVEKCKNCYTYQNKEIGWSIEVPSGWTIISKDVMEQYDEKAQDFIEKSFSRDIDMKVLNHLITFQKDPANNFAATTETFKEEFPGQYQIYFKWLNAEVYKAMINAGMKVDSTSGKEIIQNLEFSTFYTNLHGDDGEIILYQIRYNRLIGDHNFTANINYNNDNDKNILVSAFKNSKFNKK